ncbi:hypothetical protein KFE94_06470 [bacterium SCSIO 12643]|nr:hypothetical protein KFE94_06470 [bacterium SCSIO 12643]
MLEEKYTPIDCGYYDELEKIATIGKPVTMIYSEAELEQTIEQVVIYDFKTTKEGEYLFAKDAYNQYRIRLDHLISVDGILRSEYDSHSCAIKR